MSRKKTAHPLRPQDQADAKIWDAAAQVTDPEIPVISIAELGILRDAQLSNGTAVATITPTYSGCPAMETITDDVVAALHNAGYDQAEVNVVLQPAWTTDWITEQGRKDLRDYGIAPPTGKSATVNSGPIPLQIGMPSPVVCPHCGSTKTQKISHFGSTSCKALYNCQACFEPFDYFKVH